MNRPRRPRWSSLFLPALALVLGIASCVLPARAPYATGWNPNSTATDEAYGVPQEARSPVAPSADIGSVHQPTTVEPNWKERLEQPYVYLEQFGDYRALGDAMRALVGAASAAGLTATGAPFALFYDDPSTVDVARLRSRVCLPIAGPTDRITGTLSYDVLPRAMVAYAEVRGPYPELPRVYPQLFAFLDKLNWSPGVPVREIYLVNPAEVTSLEELVAEVQIPWSTTGG